MSGSVPESALVLGGGGTATLAIVVDGKHYFFPLNFKQVMALISSAAQTAERMRHKE